MRQSAREEDEDVMSGASGLSQEGDRRDVQLVLFEREMDPE